MNIKEAKIAVIGQGYVGLPLAIEFGKKYTCQMASTCITEIHDCNLRHHQEKS